MIARDEKRGELLLVLANRLTIARFALTASLGLIVVLSPPGVWQIGLMLIVVIWITDVLDGLLARRGMRLGSARFSPDGQALDPVTDDFAYAVGFVALYSAGIVPLALVALVLAVRSVFTMVRIVGLVQGRGFARPRRSGKVMGVSLGGGQIIGFAALAGIPIPTGSLWHDGLIWLMASTSAVALVDFVAVNRDVVRAVVSRSEPAPQQDHPIPLQLASQAQPSAAPTQSRSAAGSQLP